jgi:hypothetical protein
LKKSLPRFFEQDIRLTKLNKLGDPLEKLNNDIDFEIVRIILEKRLTKLAKGAGGRLPYDYVLMFKILILQRIIICLTSKFNFKSMIDLVSCDF